MLKYGRRPSAASFCQSDDLFYPTCRPSRIGFLQQPKRPCAQLLLRFHWDLFFCLGLDTFQAHFYGPLCISLEHALATRLSAFEFSQKGGYRYLLDSLAYSTYYADYMVL
jgi:hypothetical protein